MYFILNFDGYRLAKERWFLYIYLLSCGCIATEHAQSLYRTSLNWWVSKIEAVHQVINCSSCFKLTAIGLCVCVVGGGGGEKFLVEIHIKEPSCLTICGHASDGLGSKLPALSHRVCQQLNQHLNTISIWKMPAHTNTATAIYKKISISVA